jgi:hypothetical protein
MVRSCKLGSTNIFFKDPNFIQIKMNGAFVTGSTSCQIYSN